MGVDEGNLQVIDVMENCPMAIPLEVAIMVFVIPTISYI